MTSVFYGTNSQDLQSSDPLIRLFRQRGRKKERKEKKRNYESAPQKSPEMKTDLKFRTEEEWR